MSTEMSLYSHVLPRVPDNSRGRGEPLSELWVLEVKSLELTAGAKYGKSKGLRNKEVGLRRILDTEAEARRGRAGERMRESHRTA